MITLADKLTKVFDMSMNVGKKPPRKKKAAPKKRKSTAKKK